MSHTKKKRVNFSDEFKMKPNADEHVSTGRLDPPDVQQSVDVTGISQLI